MNVMVLICYPFFLSFYCMSARSFKLQLFVLVSPKPRRFFVSFVTCFLPYSENEQVIIIVIIIIISSKRANHEVFRRLLKTCGMKLYC